MRRGTLLSQGDNLAGDPPGTGLERHGMYAYDDMEGLVRPEDRVEMERRLNQELLLFRSGFESVLPDGRELFARDLQLYTRSRALVEALQVLTAAEEATRERS